MKLQLIRTVVFVTLTISSVCNTWAGVTPVPVRVSFYSVGASRWMAIQNLTRAPIRIESIEPNVVQDPIRLENTNSNTPLIDQNPGMLPACAKLFDKRSTEMISYFQSNTSVGKSTKLLRSELMTLGHEAAQSTATSAQLLSIFSADTKIQGWGEFLLLPLPPPSNGQLEEYAISISSPVTLRVLVGVPKAKLPNQQITTREEPAAAKLAKWVIAHSLLDREKVALKVAQNKLDDVTRKFTPLAVEFNAAEAKIYSVQDRLTDQERVARYMENVNSPLGEQYYKMKKEGRDARNALIEAQLRVRITTFSLLDSAVARLSIPAELQALVIKLVEENTDLKPLKTTL